MADWMFLLAPLVVLPIVVLFRFVGCGQLQGVADVEGPPPPPPPPTSPPTYRESILAETSVIAYWRLVETGDIATDQKGVHDGSYFTTSKPLQAEPPPPPPNGGSEAAPGDFLFPAAGLIESEPTAHCRTFRGGYVVALDLVASGKPLYTDEFTIEAWIRPEWGVTVTGYVHMLFFAGGHFTRFGDGIAGDHGFSVFADYANRLQVALVPGGKAFASPPTVDLANVSHIAVTVASAPGGKLVRLFLNGAEAVSGSVVAYSRPDGAALYIGVAKQTVDPALLPPVDVPPRFPMVSQIQEVVLHNKALAPEVIASHVNINHT